MKPRSRGLRYWLNLIAVGLLGFLTVGVILLLRVSYLRASAFTHPVRVQPPNGEILTQNNIPYQNVELLTSDGIKLSAWYVLPRNGAVILVAHGYNAVRPEEIILLLAKHEYGVLAWDFRAHGKSGGEISTLGYYEQRDVEAALDFALTQPDVKHIGAWGGSMGAATVILTAAHRPEIEAVISDSSFSTLEEVFQWNVPIPIMRPFVRYFAEQETGANVDFVRPIDDIGKISPRPVFIIQGLADTVANLSSGQRLYDAAGKPRVLWTEPNVPHLGMLVYYPAGYEQRVIGFFDQYLLRK